VWHILQSETLHDCLRIEVVFQGTVKDVSGEVDIADGHHEIGIACSILQSEPVLYCLIIHVVSQSTVKIAFGFVNNSDVHHKGGSIIIVFRMS
jgi:hypothetical protein